MFLNSHGDLNISWDNTDHEEMKKLIEKKIDEGYLFFVVEKKWFGLKKNKVELTKENLESKIDKQSILVKDEDLEVFIKKAKKANIKKEKSDNEYDVKSTLKKEDLKKKDIFKESTSLVATKPAIAG